MDPEWLIISAILFVAAALRAVFALVNGSDNDWHLWKVSQAAGCGKLFDFSHRVGNAMAEGWHAYANLQHTIVSRVPRRYWLLTGKALNIGYDLALVAIMYATARWWLLAAPETGSDQNTLAGVSLPVVFTLLFATAPTFFPITSRLICMGGRTLGSTFGTLYLVAMAGYLLTGSLLCLAGGVVCVLVAALASQFGLQAIVLYSVPLSLVAWSAAPVLTVAAALGIGLLIPATGLSRLLSAYWDFYRWYFRNYHTVYSVGDRNRLSDLVLLPWYFLRRPRHAIKLSLVNLSPTIALIQMPVLGLWLLWAALAPAQFWNVLTATPVNVVCTMISGCGLLLFVLTSIKPMVILGQAERYLTYCAPFVLVLTVQYAATLPSGAGWLLGLGAVQIGFIALQAVVAHVVGGHEPLVADVNPDLREVLEVLGEHPEARVLSLPTYLTFRVAAYSDHPHIRYYFEHLTLRDGGRSYMDDEIPQNHIMPRPDLEYFHEKYELNLFVVDRAFIQRATDQGIDYRLNDPAARPLVFENGTYAIYRILPSSVPLPGDVHSLAG